MIFKSIPLILVFFLCSCEQKEFKKSRNSQVETVSLLNTGDFLRVIEELEGKPNLTPRERSYLASAYSQAGGVDVFSLYSVLELQLFHKNALEWSDLSKEKNPYIKFVQENTHLSIEARQRLNEEEWGRYEDRIRNRLSSNHTMSEDKEVIAISMKLEDIRVDVFNKKLGYEKSRAEFSRLAYSADKGGFEEDAYAALVEYHLGILAYDLKKRKYLHPDEEIDGRTPHEIAKWEMLYMNVLWNTYEAIPLIKRLPTLTAKKQKSLTRALDEYHLLLKSPKLKDAALKNIALISAVSLISVLKGSFDFEHTKTTKEMFCSFKPRVLADNYSLIRSRLMFILKVLKSSDIAIQGLSTLIEQIETVKEAVPEFLSRELEDLFIDNVESLKIDHCILG